MTEGFWMFFITTVVTFSGILLGVLYKSKCSDCSFSLAEGLRFHRVVEIEMQEDHEERVAHMV